MPIRRERVEDLAPWQSQLPHHLHPLHVNQDESAVLPERWPRSRLAEQQCAAVSRQTVGSAVERNDGYSPGAFERHELQHAPVLTANDFQSRRAGSGHGHVADRPVGEPVPTLLNTRTGPRSTGVRRRGGTADADCCRRKQASGHLRPPVVGQ